MTTRIRHSAIALAIFALSQSAHAAYTVMDDDLFPTNAIPASAAPRYNPPPSTYQNTYQNDRAETYSVLFRKNIWGLSDEGKKTVMDLLPTMHGNQILITGRPDANPNQSLAEQRSNWLRAWLIKQGIPPSQIETDTKNTANNAIGNQYPIDIRIIGNRSVPTPVAPTQTFRPTSPAPTTVLTDNRIATVRQIAQTAQAGRIDAKDAIIMIAELLGATPLTPLAASASTTPKPAPAITVAPTPTPPPQPEFVLVATAETSRPKEWALSANKTLKDNVVAWAKTENYTVDWRAANYFQVGRASTLAGELLNSVDKVRTVAGLDMSVWKKDRLICIGDTQNPCTKKN